MHCKKRAKPMQAESSAFGKEMLVTCQWWVSIRSEMSSTYADFMHITLPAAMISQDPQGLIAWWFHIASVPSESMLKREKWRR